MNVGRTLDESQTVIGWTSNENQTKVQWTSNEQNSAATSAMACGGVALQLLTTQRNGEAGRALQLVAMAKAAKHCSSLLWRGRQRVVACCCDNGQ
ncbi:unnamed protein product [Sphagnum jensenii]|uniref:Uncharacterized protein n=1 Tax=Sphagnum jensenii TaxID=128206 RepID=A0ABP1BIC5_9BRYO